MRFDSFRHMLSYWAQERPDAPALRYERLTRSFSELYADVLARAEELRRGGRSCIGILADGSLACVEEIFAANLAGLQIVMLDAMAPEPLLKTLIRYTDVDCLWGDEDLCEELDAWKANNPDAKMDKEEMIKKFRDFDFSATDVGFKCCCK